MRHDDHQTLIFDADDTLWENNVLFEQAIEDFLAWIAHPTLDPVTLRATFDDIERANTVAHGYGSAVFLRSLRDLFAVLRSRPANDEELARIESLAAAITSGTVSLVPSVADTLQQLGSRHQLLLLTKGAVEEQQRKIDASGLAAHFADIHIVAEKDPATYSSVLGAHELDPRSTWMIGNSPRSDILPARAVGMGAVYIPNANTWVLEHAEVDPDDPDILHLTRFAELTTVF